MAARPALEPLERREVLATPVLTAAEVGLILDRAAGASASDDAIIAVLDRQGNLLGLRYESGVAPEIATELDTYVYAIDGAIAKARTGAFFGNAQAPLTSRTIQLISQSTMVLREIEANPNIVDITSTKGNHFPPRVPFTPQVDLYLIEHTNRDSTISPGPDRIRGTADDIVMENRFNIPDADLVPGVEIPTTESYGFLTGLLDEPAIQLAVPGGGTRPANSGQSRGIGTLPGGVPIMKNGQIVGGIGVFYPGTTGFATEENSVLNQREFFDHRLRDRSLEAEAVALIAVGGVLPAFASTGLFFNSPTFNSDRGLPPLPPSIGLISGRIDLVGITLDLFGGHGAVNGPRNVQRIVRHLTPGSPSDGTNLPVNSMGDTLIAGKAVAEGWLVLPQDAADGTLTKEDVTQIITRGIAEANRVRAAIRLPLNSTARMIFSVTDNDGNILGLFRMPDATIFSIDVAIAKARNVAYYANAAELQPPDMVTGIPPGSALTNRSFRYLALARFPEGIDGYPPGPFSILNDTGGAIGGGQSLTPLNFTSVQGFDAFFPQTNFRDPDNIANQNGIVFFPGSAPLYKDTNGDGVRELVGGLGVSGDGVDQDDDVTFAAVTNFQPPHTIKRADQTRVRGVRIPYIKFNRQPHVPRK
jgi:uncharacterized protein GlcG (DUF336 family)